MKLRRGNRVPLIAISEKNLINYIYTKMFCCRRHKGLADGTKFGQSSKAGMGNLQPASCGKLLIPSGWMIPMAANFAKPLGTPSFTTEAYPSLLSGPIHTWRFLMTEKLIPFSGGNNVWQCSWVKTQHRRPLALFDHKAINRFSAEHCAHAQPCAQHLAYLCQPLGMT